MPLLRINADKDALVPNDSGPLDGRLKSALDELATDAPVIILLHGYKFSPFDNMASPHRHIYAPRTVRGCWKSLSWPRHLGFGRGRADEGLCIAFGWEARGSIWRAWRSAGVAGRALAGLVNRIQAQRPVGVNVLAHSLGARVALSGLSRADTGSFDRMVLLSAAEFRGTARAAMDSKAGETTEIINITSRENDLFDGLVEWVVRPEFRGDRSLGFGLRAPCPNWLDLQVDDPVTRAALKGLGHRIPAPKARICHWSTYLRPGLMHLYADLIRNSEAKSLTRLRSILPRKTGREGWGLSFLPSLSRRSGIAPTGS